MIDDKGNVIPEGNDEHYENICTHVRNLRCFIDTVPDTDYDGDEWYHAFFDVINDDNKIVIYCEFSNESEMDTEYYIYNKHNGTFRDATGEEDDEYRDQDEVDAWRDQDPEQIICKDHENKILTWKRFMR